MITFRWSWIFIIHLLLVRLGNATLSNGDHTANDIRKRNGEDQSSIYLVDDTPMSASNVGVIIGFVIAGVVVAFAALGYCYVTRRRKPPPHAEEGMTSPGLKDVGKGSPELKSTFSPDESVSRKFDRIRRAFGRYKKPEESLLPSYQIHLPPGSPKSINPPPPAVPSHVPRYPSSLSRNYSKPLRRSPPPPLKGYPEPSRPLSPVESVSSDGSVDQSTQRKVQVPPKAALMVRPTLGRPLPGMSGARSAGLRAPRSPLRRKSWLLKNSFKHPFIPSPNLDAYLRYPPGSPLGQYHPSRQHLEARLDPGSPRVAVMSPRLGPKSAKETSRREPVRRQPVPLHEEDDGTTKHTRLVEALHTAEIEGQRTPTGYRTALSPVTNKHPPASSKHAPRDPPPTAYI